MNKPFMHSRQSLLQRSCGNLQAGICDLKWYKTGSEACSREGFALRHPPLYPLSACLRHSEDESRMNATRKALRRVQTVAVPPRYGQGWLGLAKPQLVPPGLRTTDTAAPPARSFPGFLVMGKHRACSAGLLHDRLHGSHLLRLVSAGYAPTASTPDDVTLQPVMPALPARLRPHDKPYWYRLAQGQAAAQPVAPKPKAAIVSLVAGFQKRALAAGDQLLADEQHPYKRQQHRQHHPLHPLTVLKVGLLEVEAGALEVAKGRLDPVALATATPGPAVSVLVEDDATGRILLARPVNDQVHWSKLVLLGQPNLLAVEPFAALNRNVAQLLPVAVLVTEPGIALHPHLPVPALSLTPALELDRAKLGIAEKRDADFLGVGKHRRQVAQQLNLDVGSRTTVGQQPAGQGDDTMVGGDADGEQTPAVVKVSTIHHQGDLGALPVREQLFGHRMIDGTPGQGTGREPAPEPLNEVFALCFDRQHRGQGGEMTVRALRQGQHEQGQVQTQGHRQRRHQRVQVVEQGCQQVECAHRVLHLRHGYRDAYGTPSTPATLSIPQTALSSVDSA